MPLVVGVAGKRSLSAREAATTGSDFNDMAVVATAVGVNPAPAVLGVEANNVEYEASAVVVVVAGGGGGPGSVEAVFKECGVTAAVAVFDDEYRAEG